MTSRPCESCGMAKAFVLADMMRFWIKETGVVASRWKGRLGSTVVPVCPRCDAYALGLEHDLGVPFYLDIFGAIATVHDWDWWNEDPRACDTRGWPDFGCVTFSDAALDASARHVARGMPSASCVAIDDRAALADIAGFPEDARLDELWPAQLAGLQDRTNGRHSAADADRAVWLLLSLVRAWADDLSIGNGAAEG